MGFRETITHKKFRISFLPLTHQFPKKISIPLGYSRNTLLKVYVFKFCGVGCAFLNNTAKYHNRKGPKLEPCGTKKDVH